jgi:dTDP-4-amino-4,6-dideoxygalactose transaminase
MKVPYLDVAARARSDRQVILDLVEQVATSDNFILKGHVAAFEERLRDFVGARFAVAVASGTDAVKLGLAALGVGRGDEVIVPAFGFVGMASVVAHLGGRVTFADVDPETGTLDPAGLEERVTPRTRAVLPAHVFSALADMPALRDFALRHDLSLLEDSAVALGARLGGRTVGRWGDLGVFSFFPIKPLGGIGEGAVIVTDDEALARRCRMLRNHGQDGITRFLHHVVGWNSRMDEVVAGYLAHRLALLPNLLARRAALAWRYTARFARLAPTVVTPAGGEGRAWYSYVVQAERRDELRSWLGSRGIEAHVHYPTPLPSQPAFADLGHRPGEFPGAERLCRRALALPLYPEMPDEHVEVVADAVAAFYARRANRSRVAVAAGGVAS